LIVEGCFIGETVPTDIDRLDSIIGGDFPPGSLILLAGNPGAGKTVFQLNSYIDALLIMARMEST